MKVHFVHGWGFDAGFWQALAALLPGIEPSFADRGYFGGQSYAAPEEGAVWITHSFGTLLALEAASQHCRALVAIAGFDRFCAGDGAAGVAPRIVERMLSRFDETPEEVVTAFRAQCGWADAFGPINAALLRNDLVRLRDGDCRVQSAALSIPVLSLHGANDTILPDAMRAHTLPNGRHLQHPTAGHLLPLEQPEWCAAQITAFLAEQC